MRKTCIFITLCILYITVSILMQSCHKKTDDSKDSNVVARINEFEITTSDFSNQFQQIYPDKQMQQVAISAKKTILNDMIKQHIILRDAYRLNYHTDDKFMKLAEKKEKILAGSAFEKRETYDKLINDDVIRQFYKLSDREIHIWQMMFKFGNNSEQKEQKRKKAEDLHKQLLGGANFKNLAVQHSEHTNAIKDSGNVHVVSCFDVDEEVFKQAYNLIEGEFSKPFIVNSAYYIILVERIYEKERDDLETEQNKIEEKLEEYYKRKLSRQMNKFRKRVLDEFHYTLLPENIDFFCKRAGTMKTKQDSINLFSVEEKARILCMTDLSEITIGQFFKNAFQYFWNSLNQRRLVEMLLLKDCYQQLKKHKGMQEGLNESLLVKEKLDEWMAGYLKSYVIEKEVIDKIDVSDRVLKPIYRNRKNSLIFKEKRSVREIFQKTEDGINKVYNLAVNGADFEALEKQYQQNKETRTNGILGPFTKGPHGKLGENAFKMKIGDINEPFRYRGGYSIIKLLSIEPAKYKTYDEAKEALKNEYLGENEGKFISEWYEKIKQNYNISINQF